MITRPVRDGAPPLLLIETPPTFGRSLRLFPHILHENVLLTLRGVQRKSSETAAELRPLTRAYGRVVLRKPKVGRLGGRSLLWLFCACGDGLFRPNALPIRTALTSLHIRSYCGTSSSTEWGYSNYRVEGKFACNPYDTAGLLVQETGFGCPPTGRLVAIWLHAQYEVRLIGEHTLMHGTPGVPGLLPRGVRTHGRVKQGFWACRRASGGLRSAWG